MSLSKAFSGQGPGAFRLFLASMVVVHHSFPLRLGGWAVYVFFILSGYWISFMWQKKYRHTSAPWVTFCLSRWWRLVPVFVTCTILGVLSSHALQQSTPQVEGIGWWLRQLLIVGSASAGRVLPPSWSLDVEMQFYLVAPLVVGALAAFPNSLRIGVTALGFAYLIAQLMRGTEAETARLDLYFGCFAAGIVLQQSNWRPSAKIAYGSLFSFFALTLVFLGLPSTRGGIWVRGQDALPTGPSFVAGWPHIWWVLGAVLVVPYIAHNVNQPSPKWDRWLGNLAFPLYMFHWICRDWYYKYVDWSQPMSRNMLLLGASWVAAFLGAAVILVLVDQPIDRIRAGWVNRRQPKKETARVHTADSISGP